MKRIFLISLTLLCTQAFATTDLVVVVNPGSGVEKMNRDDVTSIFMGRTKKLPSGVNALPIDQAAATGDKAKFYREIINKELAEVNSYWACLIFSGQGSLSR